MNQVTLYGLTKCSTCLKARRWLDRHKIAHTFVDYRDHRVDAATLKQWKTAVGGWEALVNRSGTTWRSLPVTRKEPGSDAEWVLLIKEYPALVRRPVSVLGNAEVQLGFSDKLYARVFAKGA